MTACPLCKHSVNVPSLDEAKAAYKLAGYEGAILEAVWAGRGLPVQTILIFDAMYIDDPDGGPSPTQTYRAFYRAIRGLRQKLGRSGISIDNVGYRKGYRLQLRDAAQR